MGGCRSVELRRDETAKLILPDGTLQEFSSAVKAWQVLQKNPTCFVCNSDDMDFDEVISAVNGNAELRPGHLYFVLPLTWLNHPLRAEEMAALAVKASSALMKSGGAWGYWTSDDDDSFSDGKLKSPRTLTDGGGCGKGRRRFTAMLSTIPE